jgi:hypothetical protein
MAAATTAISAGLALAGTGMSLGQLAKSFQDKKKAEQDAIDAINKASKITELDTFSSLQVPTMGSELQQQSADRSTSQALQMVSGTPEMAIGAAPGLVQANMEQTREIGGDLDALKYQRDLDQAKNKARIEMGRVGREEDIIGVQLQRANVDRQQAQLNQQAGIKGLFEGAQNTLGAVDKMVPLYQAKRKKRLATKNEPDVNVPSGNDYRSQIVMPNYGTEVAGVNPSSYWGMSGLGYQNQVIPNP